MGKSNFFEIHSAEEFNELVAKHELVAIDFTATWCGPCKVIGPIFKLLSDSFENVVFLKVDVDDFGEIAGKYKIQAMPTFKFLRNGEVTGEFVGANKTKLEEGIAALAGLAAPAEDAAVAGEAAPAA
ncbi:hypothetical protein LPJ61_005144 [Coemansia biformis]|uniref:Thioredoxin domain-containing protein n=1 Tax=Coemansia biformis TaxID=1286918 RepID=A0A9W7Y9P0_9FUNG|nr:hypothetical protein LPJ61_005144 [Coemansia biformis]